MKRVLSVVGTRPEAIKLAPILRVLQEDGRFESEVCVTGQHPDLVDRAILPATTSHLLRVPSGPPEIVASGVLAGMGEVLRVHPPDVVVVQGDTTSAFSAGLAAYYVGVPVAHVEAGLRTGDLSAPWPEEGHRQALARLATWHFAPTSRARRNLLAEGILDSAIWVVGNTAVDALQHVGGTPGRRATRRSVLVTLHRRESLGPPLRDVCLAVRRVAERWPDVRVVWPVHPHTAARCRIAELVVGPSNIEIVAPMGHGEFVRLAEMATFLLTDSGGLQEEAPYLGKPVVVLRDATERPEVVDAGTATLVGTHPDRIVEACAALLDDPSTLASMSRVHHPFGDGRTAERIVGVLATVLGCDVPQKAAK